MFLTVRQGEYLYTMNRFFRDNDQLPPVDVLAKLMGVSPNAAHEALERLERVGAIEKNSCGKWMFKR